MGRVDKNFETEVLTRLARIETEVLTRLARIETKLEDYDNIKTKAEEARAKAYINERRINEIEEKQKWLSRTIWGAVITGLVAIVMAFFKLGIGID